MHTAVHLFQLPRFSFTAPLPQIFQATLVSFLFLQPFLLTLTRRIFPPARRVQLPFLLVFLFRSLCFFPVSSAPFSDGRFARIAFALRIDLVQSPAHVPKELLHYRYGRRRPPLQSSVLFGISPVAGHATGKI